MLGEAEKADIPVYFIRIGDPDRKQRGVSDEAWAAAVARTGGKFYNAVDETHDRARGPGHQSLGARPHRDTPVHDGAAASSAPFALAAVMLWTAAIVLRLTLPWFQTFP